MSKCPDCGSTTLDVPNSKGGFRSRCRKCYNAWRVMMRHGPRFDIDVELDEKIESMMGLTDQLRTPGSRIGAPGPDYQLHDVFKALKPGPLLFEDLCNKLKLSPKDTRAAIDAARRQGLAIVLEHDHVAFSPEKPRDDLQESGVEPVVGETQRVAVISDLHIGSRYCLYGPLREFVKHAYSLGVREILCPGDIIDGNYTSHGLNELTHVGLDNQTALAARQLPRLPGLSYCAILGNHDLTFEEQNGANPGRALLGAFSAAGRDDLRVYGSRGAYLRVRGVVVHLWHPRGGNAYATSYKLQKKIESYSSGEKPGVLLAGHWHRYCHVLERGVHALACPTFQGGGSAFSKSMTGSTAIGGLVLEWDLTEHGTIRAFRHEVRQYFERERPVEIG